MIFCRVLRRVENLIEEAVTKVTDTPTQEDFQGAFHKLLERYNKCITSKGTRVSCEYYE